MDPTNIGVNENNFYNQRLYGSENLNISKVIDASTYGVNGTDYKDDTLALVEAITEASQYKGDGFVQIKLPEGDLDFIEQVNTILSSITEDMRNEIMATAVNKNSGE